jgi:hypothetical protein
MAFSSDLQTDHNDLSEQQYDALNRLVDKHVLIANVGDEFRKAVEDIMADSVVGLSVEGIMFGPYSQASLVSFATPSRVYLFDVYTVGVAAFENGLCDILTSEQTEKVIYNCRIVSDYLHHKHQVAIGYVYDTQVVDLMSTQVKSRQFPLYRHSLPQCLGTYLNIPAHLIYCPEIPEGTTMESLQWNK